MWVLCRDSQGLRRKSSAVDTGPCPLWAQARPVSSPPWIVCSNHKVLLGFGSPCMMSLELCPRLIMPSGRLFISSIRTRQTLGGRKLEIATFFSILTLKESETPCGVSAALTLPYPTNPAPQAVRSDLCSVAKDPEYMRVCVCTRARAGWCVGL